MSARTAARPPRWARGPVVEVVEVHDRDDRTVRVLGTALGIALWAWLVAEMVAWVRSW